MANKWTGYVEAFHSAFGHPVETTPTLLDEETKALRLALIEEELDELTNALYNDDLVETADALGDLIYVVVGTAVASGIDLDPVLDEIQISNMSKIDVDGKVHYHPNGKVKKPEHWQAPDIAGVIEEQTRA